MTVEQKTLIISKKDKFRGREKDFFLYQLSNGFNYIEKDGENEQSWTAPTLRELYKQPFLVASPFDDGGFIEGFTLEDSYLPIMLTFAPYEKGTVHPEIFSYLMNDLFYEANKCYTHYSVLTKTGYIQGKRCEIRYLKEHYNFIKTVDAQCFYFDQGESWVGENPEYLEEMARVTDNEYAKEMGAEDFTWEITLTRNHEEYYYHGYQHIFVRPDEPDVYNRVFGRSETLRGLVPLLQKDLARYAFLPSGESRWGSDSSIFQKVLDQLGLALIKESENNLNNPKT